jgi:hypothetical protein
MANLITEWTVNEDGDFVVLARILGAAGAPITQASVTSIALTVTPLDEFGNGGTPTIDEQSVTIATSVYDTAQTDATLWPNPPHTAGFNFKHQIPASAVPEGDTEYAIKFTFTMASSGGTIQVPLRVHTYPVH